METNIFKMITIADIASLANALCGFLSIIMIIQNNIVLSAQLLLLAVVFDSIDGSLARYFNQGDVDHIIFGEMIDSLADVVSFGVAPAVILYIISGQMYMLIPSILLVLCGILRLSRYNTVSAYSNQPTVTFIGLPIPVTSFILAAFMLSSYNLILLFVVMTGISLLMISNIEYPKINEIPILATICALVVLTIIPTLNNILHKIPAYLLILLILLYIVGFIVISIYDRPNVSNKVKDISNLTNSLNKR